MAPISNVNNTLLQTQLANIQVRHDIGTKIMAKTLDVARDQGQAALTLLDAATQIGQSSQSKPPTLTFGALASGLGQNLDLQA